jgi:phenylacetate-CoA ligase
MMLRVRMSMHKYFKNSMVMNAYRLWNHSGKTGHLKILNELDKSQYYESERLHELQVKKLQKLILHAIEYSPFWQRRFKDLSLQVGDIDKLTDTKDIPILTRENVISHRDEIVSGNFNASELTENVSGGTTGSSLSYFLNDHRIDYRTATTLRHNLWAGYRIGDKLATIWGAPGDLPVTKSIKTSMREMLWGKSIDLNSNIITEESLRAYAAEWNRFKPDILLAYAGSLGFFVKKARSMGITLESPKAIITSAEILTPEIRKSAQEYFGAEIFNRYGSREFSVMASECENHDSLHINAETLLLEFEQIDESFDDKKHARLFITDLENYAFPFIRYEIGDVVVLADEDEGCPCGRTLPKIQDVGGRITDYLKLSNGRYVSCTGLASTVFPKAKGIIQSRVIQSEQDRICVQIVKNENFDDDSIKMLRNELGKILGGNIAVEFEFPEKLEREKSGKYRFAISEVAE